MSGEPERYTRFPEIGQYYAIRSALALAQITRMGPYGFGVEPENITFNVWTPASNSIEATYLYLKPDTADYLWFNRVIEFTAHFGVECVEGDVWITTRSRRLWFVGPDSNNRGLHVLASWDIAESDLLMSVLYQPGAGRQTPRCMTSFERIMEDKS